MKLQTILATAILLGCSAFADEILLDGGKFVPVDSKTIEEALETLEDEDINAYNVAKKYIKNKPFDFELKAKAFRYLISKGFSYDNATGALDKISAELKQE